GGARCPRRSGQCRQVRGVWSGAVAFAPILAQGLTRVPFGLAVAVRVAAVVVPLAFAASVAVALTLLVAVVGRGFCLRFRRGRGSQRARRGSAPVAAPASAQASVHACRVVGGAEI